MAIRESPRSGFIHSNIQINLNWVALSHRDFNDGESILVLTGYFTGGDFCLATNDDGKKDPRIVAAAPETSTVTFNNRGFFLQFEGRKTHYTAPFTGVRMSFIFFNIRKGSHLPKENKAIIEALSNLGFEWAARGKKAPAQGSPGHEKPSPTSG